MEFLVPHLRKGGYIITIKPTAMGMDVGADAELIEERNDAWHAMVGGDRATMQK